MKLNAKKNNLEKLMLIGDVEGVREFVNENDIEDLKKLDFGICFRGEGKFDQILIRMKELVCQDKVGYISEIEIINEIFKECALLQNKIRKIPAKFVLSLIIHWGSVFIDNFTSKQVKEMFSEQRPDEVLAYEKGAGYVIAAFKSLKYDSRLYDGERFIFLAKTLPIEKVLKCRKVIAEYLENSFVASSWLETYESWREGSLSLSRNSPTSIEIKITDREVMCKRTYAKLKDKINTSFAELREANYFKFRRMASGEKMPKNSFTMFVQGATQKFMDKHFYCDSRDLMVKDVKVSEWIAAYHTLMRISQNNIDKSDMMPWWKRWLYTRARCKTKKAWIGIFMKEGVRQASAEIIFDSLTFNKKSVDLYDYPIIPVGEKFTIFRAITKKASPALSLISRFSSKDVNVDIKGKGFENNLLVFFKEFNIPFVQLHHKIGGLEYECDAVFYIDDTFVFCECKHRTGCDVETFDSQGYANDAQQLSRIMKFYESNMKYVFGAFESRGVKIKSKKFYETKGIVIHSRAVDGLVIHDGIHVMDFNNFILPFDRGSFQEVYVKDRKLRKVFEGDVTVHKLFKFYNTPFYIEDYRNKVEFIKREFQLGKFSLNRETYVINEVFNAEFMRKENIRCMKGILRHNGFTGDEIEMMVCDL